MTSIVFDQAEYRFNYRVAAIAIRYAIEVPRELRPSVLLRFKRKDGDRDIELRWQPLRTPCSSSSD